MLWNPTNQTKPKQYSYLFKILFIFKSIKLVVFVINYDTNTIIIVIKYCIIFFFFSIKNIANATF